MVDALDTLKEYGDMHPQNYQCYIDTLRLLGRIQNKKLIDHEFTFTVDFIDNWPGRSQDPISKWVYDGEVDEFDEPQGLGKATTTETQPDGSIVTKTITGTFRQGQPYGIVVL